MPRRRVCINELDEARIGVWDGRLVMYSQAWVRKMGIRSGLLSSFSPRLQDGFVIALNTSDGACSIASCH